MLSKNAEIGVFIIVTTGLILVLIGFIILILFIYKRKQHDFRQNLEMQKIEYEKKLLSTQLEMQEQTLKHISREIHDNISSTLSFAMLNLKSIHWDRADDVRYKVDSSGKQVSKAMEDLRYLSKTLNGDYIKEFGLLNGIEHEIQYIRGLNLFETNIELDGTPVYLEDTKREVIIFRIIQEALNNSVKHARSATRLLIKIQFTPSHLHITVCDNGKSWKTTNAGEGYKNGMGLKNMEQRTLMLNGTFHIQHIPLQGTTVSLSIPVKT